MATRPEPPAYPDTAATLVEHVSEHPEDWMFYLRSMNGYSVSIEEENATLRATISSLQTEIARGDAIIGYQKEQLNERDERTSKTAEKIGRLEAEKAQLLAAATPVVHTPPTDPLSTTNPPAEHLADTAPGTSTHAPAPPTGSAFISEKLPDPEKFDGSRTDLRRFTQQIYGKMIANTDRFPTAPGRLTYVAGRLTGKAYQLMLPKIAYGLPQFSDYPDMLAYLEAAFGDPDRVQNAQNKLYQLKQRNDDFSTYFSEFQRLALEGEMAEEGLTPLLFQGISRELQDMLLHNPSPSRQFRAYAQHLQSLDNRYRQHQKQVNRTRLNYAPRTPTPVSYAQAASPRATPEPPRRSGSPHPTRSQSQGDPMDLSAQRTPRPNGRRERGECYRCGSKDHRVALCPEPDTRPYMQARTVRAERPFSPDTDRSLSPPPSFPASVNGASLG
jgi:hypothetical protein